MQDGAERNYSAFISYTDADRALARRLQARLERYKLPRRLAERLGYARIKPVFVDRSEMRATHDLDDAIREALDRSDFLIVLCTPRTPASHWVGREIDLFRELRGDRSILVALFDGEKADCFHQRLMASRSTEPLAADFRRQGDGKRLALLKLLASLVGVNLDDLVHRDARRQLQHLLVSSGVVSATALTIAVLSYTAYSERAAADANRIRASQAMESQLKDMRERIKSGGTLDMAAALNRNVELFYEGQSTSSALPEVELGRAKLLHAKADDERTRGDLRAAASDARAAWKITAGVLQRQPDDPDTIYDHAQSAYYVGYVAWLQRDTPLAANAFDRYAELADRLVALAPGNDDYRMEQGYAYSNLGMIALREARDPARAERYFSAAQAAFRDVAGRNPDDPDKIYEMTDGEAWLADVELARRDFRAAQRHRDEQAKLVRALLKRDPDNRLYQSDLVSSRIGQARLYAAQGKHRQALDELVAASSGARQVLAADPENAAAAGRKRAIELFQAQSELALGDRRAAARALGSCTPDWAKDSGKELAAFCSILAARIALLGGDKVGARKIMGDPRLGEWLGSRSLSPTWRLDFPEECRKLGDRALCR